MSAAIGHIEPQRRRSPWARVGSGGILAGLFFILAGDRGVQTAALSGIDPLEILRQQVKPNVLILLDTSASMKWAVDADNFPVGGDDPRGRFNRAKGALTSALTEYTGRANFGLATFNGDPGYPTSDWTLNRTDNADGPNDGIDGPLVFVSTDANASLWLGVFNAALDAPLAAQIKESLMNVGPYASGYPNGCTAGTDCNYYIQSRFMRSQVRFLRDPFTGVFTSVADVTIPAQCFELDDTTGGRRARYCVAGGIFQAPNGRNQNNARLVDSVAGCSTNNVPTILQRLQPSLPAASAAALLVDTDLRGVNPVAGGLRADLGTPLDRALATAGGFLPAPIGTQKNFIILVTDNLTDAAVNEDGAVANPTNFIRQTANDAATLSGNGTTTLVVAVGVGVGATVNGGRVNDIARAGSGGTLSGGNYTCPAGSFTCHDAFVGTTRSALDTALRAALDIATNSGEFSATQAIIGTVFERVQSPADPLDPKTRYSQRVNLLYQSTFEVPGWGGHLIAYKNDGTFASVSASVTCAVGQWDAGDALYCQNGKVMETSSGTGGINAFTFDELHGGTTVDTIDGSNALIKRRIFTSNGNGTFLRSAANQFDSALDTGRNVIALWPPNQTGLSSGVSDIDPAAGTTTLIDDAMGIGPNSTPVLTFLQLRNDLGGCSASADGGAAPAACDNAANATLALDTARKEAREILLAFNAGAKLIRSANDQKPVRSATGRLLYQSRGWLLGDSTLATPAVVTPPLKFTPSVHSKEWVLFRDGRRNSNREGINEVDQGFGLRNPDFDDSNPTSKTDLKPRMTVVYLGANDMLHAFSGDTSEELWGYVPFDQLLKIKDLMLQGQVQDPHTYVVAASVRVVDVFVPSPFTLGGIAYDGHWRTVIYFGRGAGGKYLTAIDVTAPGPFTRRALKTNPPFVMWNRGNPDNVGRVSGSGTADATGFYAKMGQTWSTPAVGNVNAADAAYGVPEWRVFVGSGYGSGTNASNEGTVLYVLDAVSGDVVTTSNLQTKDVGDGVRTNIAENALVAGPALYNSFLLDPPQTVTARGADFVTRAYIPDVHGRIWKFAATSAGAFGTPTSPQNHPFGAGVALMKLPVSGGTAAFVFAESGNDNRFINPYADPPLATPPFKMFAYKDAVDTTTSQPGDTTFVAGTQAFNKDFPQRFRGTSQPGVAFELDPASNTAFGRVFFVGTQFVPGNPVCGGHFDSILFGLGAETGISAFDFGGTPGSTTFTNSRKSGPQVVGGQVMLSEGSPSGSSGPPPPPPNALPTPGPPAAATIVTTAQTNNTAICRQ